jgi:hypothetical protein
MTTQGHLSFQQFVTNENAQTMKDLILNATLAFQWEAYVQHVMEEKPYRLPDYLSSFYYMGNDDVDPAGSDIPTMHACINNSDEVNRHFDDYMKLKPKMQTSEHFFVSTTEKVCEHDNINDIHYHLEEERIQGFMATFNFLTLGLFTHMGIRIPGSREKFLQETKGTIEEEPKNAFCFVPGCQPKFNNRDIPVREWLWDEPAGKRSLINAIESGDELPWSSQACFVIPYQVKSINNTEEARKEETPIKCVLERIQNQSKTETRKDLDLFDGNLVAQEASFDEAVKAFEAIAVR